MFSQGVIVLSRQWKNILYTPLLIEQGYRSKVLKPLNVTFALPDLLEVCLIWIVHAYTHADIYILYNL